MILLHIEPTSATYAQVLCGFKLNRGSPSFEQKLIVHPPLVTHRLSPSIFKLPLPRRLAAFQFSAMEMEKSFCFRFSWWRTHLMFLARLLTHSGFLTKMAALLTTQFPTDVLVWLGAHQHTSNFCSPRPIPRKKRGKKRARLNLLFISILLARGDNFPHREICTQWSGWLARRLLLAREITPLVSCIVCIRCCSPFFFFLFFFCHAAQINLVQITECNCLSPPISLAEVSPSFLRLSVHMELRLFVSPFSW